MNPGEQGAEPFQSPVPWQDSEPDCLVIACSDHRFTEHIDAFVRHLGFQHAHSIRFPGGIVVGNPLLSAMHFLPKFTDFVIDRVLETKKRVRTILCIAHEDCGAYKETSKHNLLDQGVRKLTGKSIRETHLQHLGKAARRLRDTLAGTTVRAFFAEVTDGPEAAVVFRELDG